MFRQRMKQIALQHDKTEIKNCNEIAEKLLINANERKGREKDKETFL